MYPGPLGRVPRSLDRVEDSTTDGAHAEGAADVVDDAPRAGLSVGNAVSGHDYLCVCSKSIGTYEEAAQCSCLETRQEGQQPENPGGEMRCNEGLVPTERKEKKRQDVHAAELASAFDTRKWEVENWTVDRAFSSCGQ